MTRFYGNNTIVNIVMNHKHNNVIIYSAIAALVVFFIAFRFLNTSLQRQLEVQIRKEAEESMLKVLKVARQEESKKEKEIAGENALAPYAIKVQKQSALLENQYYWDSNTKMILGGTDIIGRMDASGAFKGNKKTSIQFQKQIERIDGRIEEYRVKVENDPGDDAARQKLQSLYMLRATVGSLEGVVVKE